MRPESLARTHNKQQNSRALAAADREQALFALSQPFHWERDIFSLAQEISSPINSYSLSPHYELSKNWLSWVSEIPLLGSLASQRQSSRVAGWSLSSADVPCARQDCFPWNWPLWLGGDKPRWIESINRVSTPHWQPVHSDLSEMALLTIYYHFSHIPYCDLNVAADRLHVQPPEKFNGKSCTLGTILR